MIPKTAHISADVIEKMIPLIREVATPYIVSKDSLREDQKGSFKELDGTDLVICAHLLSENGRLVINDPLTKSMEMTGEQLIDLAVRNQSKWKYVLTPMTSVIEGILGTKIDEEDDVVPPLYVLTNKQMMYGAGEILDDDAMDEALEKLGGSFYIIPSSVHEVLLYPQTIEANELRTIVKEVNIAIVKPEERLSDNIYVYDRVTRSIRIIQP